MDSDSLNKEYCNICNGTGINSGNECKTCSGDGYLYYFNGNRVSREEYRECYNSKIMLEFEYSEDYCYKCNRFIKYEGGSETKGLCESCHSKLEDQKLD